MSHLTTMRIFPLIAVAIGLGSMMMACHSRPGNIISEKKMAEILADVYVGEAVIESTPQLFTTDSARRAFKQEIFARHGVTNADVDTSLFWYGYNVEQYMEVCRQTEEIIKERIAEAEKKGALDTDARRTASIDGDSVNLWSGPSMSRNSTFTPGDFITFSLPRDKNWERGDRYALTGKGVLTRGPIEMVLAVDYNDGATEYVAMRQDASERAQKLVLVLDSMKTATTVYGYIRYTASPGEVSYLDSLSLVRTRGKNNNKAARAAQHHTRHQ